MKIVRDNKEYELTNHELYLAYTEYEDMCYNEDLDNHLEYSNYSESEKSYIEYDRDTIIYRYKKFRDDYNADWSDALYDAVHESLNERMPETSSIIIITDWNKWLKV